MTWFVTWVVSTILTVLAFGGFYHFIVWWEKHPEAMNALDVGGARMMVIDCDPGFKMEEL